MTVYPGDKVKVTLVTYKKSLVISIFNVNIKSVPKTVTDLWTFVYLIGYGKKIKLLPIKSKNEDAVILFCVCLVVFT